jgi:hypothetical protein
MSKRLYSKMSRISSGDHPPSYWMCTGATFLVIYSWGMKLTTYLHLIPRLREGEREGGRGRGREGEGGREAAAILPLPICLFDMYRDFTLITAQHY